MKLGLKTSAFLLSFSALSAASQIFPSDRRSEDTGDSSNKVAAAWFAGYHEHQFPPEKVPWKKYTDVFYAFA